MVAIKPFEVERWMDAHENDAKFNLAETCSASISLNDLLALSSDQSQGLINLSRKQVYGAIRGSEQLRNNIANLYSTDAGETLPPDGILVTPGAISANFLVLFAMVSPGDHVICQYPTYQQLYSVPETHGAEVSLWKSDSKQSWHLSFEALKGMIRPSTRLIIINNPQNPTGAVMDRQTLAQVVELARERGIWILGDEVYRPLYHGLAEHEQPPSVLSMGYDKTISTCSMSKAFSLAGIRLGWIASRSAELIEKCANIRDYTTISVSQIDDEVGTFALSSPTVDNLLRRNMSLAARNAAALETFIQEHNTLCRWTRPKGGTTAFVMFVTASGQPVDDVAFCEKLQESAGVMFVPGSRCFGDGVDFKGYVRVGYVPESDVMDRGLDALRKFMKEQYHELPAAPA